MCSGSFAVTVNCHKGKLFNLYAFNTFATSLADAHLQKGDFVAFRSAYIEENTRYRIENECHDLQARIGIPSLPGSKIFFIRKSQITVSVFIWFCMNVLEEVIALDAECCFHQVNLEV
jgi:hypothetical protein